MVSRYPAIWFSQADSSIKPVGMAGASLLKTRRRPAIRWCIGSGEHREHVAGVEGTPSGGHAGPVLVREPVPPVFQK